MERMGIVSINDVFEKAIRIGEYKRVRRGKMERVKEYERAGEKRMRLKAKEKAKAKVVEKEAKYRVPAVPPLKGLKVEEYRGLLKLGYNWKEIKGMKLDAAKAAYWNKVKPGEVKEEGVKAEKKKLEAALEEKKEEKEKAPEEEVPEEPEGDLLGAEAEKPWRLRLPSKEETRAFQRDHKELVNTSRKINRYWDSWSQSVKEKPKSEKTARLKQKLGSLISKFLELVKRLIRRLKGGPKWEMTGEQKEYLGKRMKELEFARKVAKGRQRYLEERRVGKEKIAKETKSKAAEIERKRQEGYKKWREEKTKQKELVKAVFHPWEDRMIERIERLRREPLREKVRKLARETKGPGKTEWVREKRGKMEWVHRKKNIILKRPVQGKIPEA